MKEDEEANQERRHLCDEETWSERKTERMRESKEEAGEVEGAREDEKGH